MHAVLVAWICFCNSPNIDECGHLAAGVHILETGEFDLYKVNPPLVKLIAAVPVKLLSPKTKWTGNGKVGSKLGTRYEFSTGIAFVQNNQDRSRIYFTVARLACIPFSLIGAFFCWRWARELYGPEAGILASVLWCFSPNVLAWSSTLCPDAPAAALGIVAGYYFWKWLKQDDWTSAINAGFVLGLALLTKLTWILLLLVWPIASFCWYCRRRDDTYSWTIRLSWILVLGLVILNLGYLYEGTFTQLGDFNFASKTLAGDESIVDGGEGGNRFSNTWLGAIPVPLPKNYVEGADIQKVDFEEGKSSYLFGEWKDRGWWYYYLVCSSVKVPLGTIFLGITAVGVTLLRFRKAHRHPDDYKSSQEADINYNEQFLLFVPVVLFAFVSYQTGFSRHFRYVLPALPFVYVWISRLASENLWRTSQIFRSAVKGLVIWSVTSSLWIYPHSMSYFNELAGGPRGGHKYLLQSNLDWGQDIYELNKWFEARPSTRPRFISFCDALGSRVFHCEYEQELLFNPDLLEEQASLTPWKAQGTKWWYAVSVNKLYGPHQEHVMPYKMKLVAEVGYTFQIYECTAFPNGDGE